MSNRHLIASALTVVASTAAIMLVGAQLAHAVGPNKITNWGSRFCLDVGHYGNLYENGVRIQQWGCSGGSRQVWNFTVTSSRHNGIGYKISNAESREVLRRRGRQERRSDASAAMGLQNRRVRGKPNLARRSVRTDANRLRDRARGASTSPADRSSRAPICRPTTAQQTTPPRYSSLSRTRWLRTRCSHGPIAPTSTFPAAAICPLSSSTWLSIVPSSAGHLPRGWFVSLSRFWVYPRMVSQGLAAL